VKFGPPKRSDLIVRFAIQISEEGPSEVTLSRPRVFLSHAAMGN
jgi:hypothetical protein